MPIIALLSKEQIEQGTFKEPSIARVTRNELVEQDAISYPVTMNKRSLLPWLFLTPIAAALTIRVLRSLGLEMPALNSKEETSTSLVVIDKVVKFSFDIALVD